MSEVLLRQYHSQLAAIWPPLMHSTSRDEPSSRVGPSGSTLRATLDTLQLPHTSLTLVTWFELFSPLAIARVPVPGADPWFLFTVTQAVDETRRLRNNARLLQDARTLWQDDWLAVGEINSERWLVFGCGSDGHHPVLDVTWEDPGVYALVIEGPANLVAAWGSAVRQEQR